MADAQVVLLGARGMLGTDIAELFTKQGRSVCQYDLPEFDICNVEQLKQVVPTDGIVINCAAYTNVDQAQSQPDIAFAVNAHAVGNLGTIAAQKNAYIVHFSTDYVFDGCSDAAYREMDAVSPINVYGQSKLEGEALLNASGCKHCTIRIEWTYGRNGSNFVTKMIDLAQQHDKLRVVDDQIGSPTSTKQIADVVFELISKDSRPLGLYHYAAAGRATKFEIVKFIVDTLKLPVEVCPCKSQEFPTPAKRPANSRLCCDKIQALLEKPIPKWQDTLKEFLSRKI